MKALYKLITVTMILFILSLMVMKSITVDVNSDVGKRLLSIWYEEIGNVLLNDINSFTAILHQALALTLFLMVVAATVFKMEWRVAAALLSLCTIVLIGLVPPQTLITSAVEWNLILFLIGSMTLAGILRKLGTFEYLAIRIVEVSKGSALRLITLMLALAFILSALLGEVTSIIYVVTLIFELNRLIKFDVKPLIVLSVLATNTGSVALPIGNPIGIYLFFTANMSMSEFIKYGFTVALIGFILILAIIYLTNKRTLMEFSKALISSGRSVDTYITSYYMRVTRRELRMAYAGIVILSMFIATVVLNEHLSEYLSVFSGTRIDPHSLLAFIPYAYIVLSMAFIPPESISEFIRDSVEWPSLLFFISLFILSYSLTYSGAMIKIAYVISYIRYPALLMPTMLWSSAILSSVLDNLSVIVSMTPIATLLNSLGLVGRGIFFALLYGGVYGGNYTPIGSTANIVAISICESRGISIKWGEWLKIALITTTAQLIASLSLLYVI